MRVDVWSDVVCPWCYIGKRRLEAALAGFAEPVELRWHSFELDPDAPAVHEDGAAAHLARKYGRTTEQAQQMLDEMTALAARDGLDYHFELAHTGNTFDAHRLLHLAADRGVQDSLKERLFRATFTEGRTIGEPATLVELAVDAGLDRDEASAVLAGDGYAAAVREDEAQAARLGITGVPFFVIDGKYGVSGAQPAPVLRDVLDRAAAERAPLTVVGGDAAACDGDSCAV